MKVNGQLEVAQLEQLAADPALAPTGRVYANIASPSAAVLKYFDGTTWKTLQTTSTQTVISQNSGKAVTIDWSQGRNQKVTLTDNAVISFINPQEGYLHRLFVVQNNTYGSNVLDTKLYTLNMADQAAQRSALQPPTVMAQASVTNYEWFYTAGISPARSTSYLGDTVAPTTAVAALALSGDGKILVSGGTTTPFTSYFDIFDVPVAVQTQMVAKATPAPTAAAAAVKGMVFTPDMRAIFVVSGTTPFIQGWALDRGVASGTAFTNPGTLPTGAGQSIAMHPGGYYVAVGHTTTPFCSIYPLIQSGAAYGYGAKLTNPVTLPAALVTGVAWSPQGDYIATACQTTPFIQAWSFPGIWGTAVANPTTLPAGGPSGQIGHGIAWRPQGDWIAMGMTVTPYLYVVPFNRSTGTFGTPLTVTALAAAVNGVAWSPCGQYLLCAINASPGLIIYDFAAQTLVAVTSDNGTPGVACSDVVVHPNGETAYVGVSGSALIYNIGMPIKVKNYVRQLE